MNTKTKNRSLVVVAIIALAVMAIEAIIATVAYDTKAFVILFFAVILSLGILFYIEHYITKGSYEICKVYVLIIEGVDALLLCTLVYLKVDVVVAGICNILIVLLHKKIIDKISTLF